MNKVNILDCTLRDGGYVNLWQFGKDNIKKTIKKLVEANIDIVECGFLTETKEGSENTSLFNTVEEIKEYLPKDRGNSTLVCMINYGECDGKNLPECDGTSIDGLRVAFHKKDRKGAMQLCKRLIDKGYKVFVQPMVSISYQDEEFISLIREANDIKPYAFYIVDSFGVMKRKDLLRLYYLVDHNLDKEINVGYHPHNNIQMAYANSQALVDLKTNREMIIDSSVFGMGRGAGNLNTELFIEHLNDVNNCDYKARPLLQIIDQVLVSVYQDKYWGYSLPHYVSAMQNCHPNYASYLDNKNTLTIGNINEIIESMDDSKRNGFDTEYIETLYSNYQNKMHVDKKSRKLLKEQLKGKSVVLIAPGSSIKAEQDKVKSALAKDNTVSISVNFNPDDYDCDFTFVSNIRRYRELQDKSELQLITTSNVGSEENESIIINYSDLTNDITAVEDNSGLMLIKLLIDLGVKEIGLAGIDGYSHGLYENFAKKEMAFIKSDDVMDAMNEGMKKMLKEYAAKVTIKFVTTPKYINI